MNTILDALHRFSQWSGMRMNLKKCEITGFDFARNREMGEAALSTIRLNGERLTALRGSAAFKYLGIRLAANGGTKEERQYVRDTTTKIAQLSRHHPYHAYQMECILRSAV